MYLGEINKKMYVIFQTKIMYVKHFQHICKILLLEVILESITFQQKFMSTVE